MPSEETAAAATTPFGAATSRKRPLDESCSTPPFDCVQNSNSEHGVSSACAPSHTNAPREHEDDGIMTTALLVGQHSSKNGRDEPSDAVVGRADDDDANNLGLLAAPTSRRGSSTGTANEKVEEDDPPRTSTGPSTSSTVPCSPSEYIHRPPVSDLEVNEAIQQIGDTLDHARGMINEKGFDVYRRWAYGLDNTDGWDGDGDSNEMLDKGMDTDDEAEAEREKAQQALADAVVKGSPRRYQLDLFELAKKRNTIVNLGTGRGKTLIALLCIRHFATINNAFENGKQTLFLVPSVALAQQHTTTLRANLPFTVATACSTTTRSDRAKAELRQANIVLATHGSAADLLNHYNDVLSMANVNLLIIDECHYCRDGHQYKSIMDTHYKALPIVERPRVLGLTASIFINVKFSHCTESKLERMLVEMEHTLDSRLACFDPDANGSKAIACSSESSDHGECSENEVDQNELIKTATERPIHYFRERPPQDLPSFDGSTLHEHRQKELRQLTELYNELGARVTSIYMNTLSREVSRNRYEKESPEEFHSFIAHLKKLADFCKGVCKLCPNGGRTEKVAVLEELLERLIEDGEAGEDAVGVVFTERRITALALYDYFRSRNDEIGRGTWPRVAGTPWSRRGGDNKKKRRVNIDPVRDILAKAVPGDDDIDNDGGEDDGFIDTKMLDGEQVPHTSDTGAEMGNAVPRAESLAAKEGAVFDKTIRCDVLVRECTKVMKYLNKKHRRITEDDGEAKDLPWLHNDADTQSVLDGLRRNDTNVLIATSVVEEGVDVAACSFVIVFDSIRTTKGYTQMKGRARKGSSKFFVFQDTHPEATSPTMTLQAAQEVERAVSRFIRSRGDNLPTFTPKLVLTKYSRETLVAELKAIEENQYCGKSGRVDLSSAKGVLNRYACAMPMDASTRMSRDSMLLHLPQFNDYFLTLPAHLPATVRCVNLPEKYWNAGRKDRESMMAMMAVVRLHYLGLLNDRLLPIRKRDLRQKLLSVALVEMPKISPPRQLASPPLSGESKTVYFYALTQTGILFNQNASVCGANGRSLCIVTLKPLPAGGLPTLVFDHAELKEVECKLGVPVTTKLSISEWNRIATFFATIMNTRFRRRNKPAWYRYSIEKARNGVVGTYIVGCLTKEGSLDWDRMDKIVADYQRSEEEKAAAVGSLDGSSGDLEEPRLWSPRYDPYVTYIAFRPSGLDCTEPFPSISDDVKTYQDYFSRRHDFHVDASSDLYAVQRMWHLPKRLPRVGTQRTKARESSEARTTQGKKRMPWEKDAEDYVLQKGETAPCDGLTACLLPKDACFEAALADASMALHCMLLPQVLFYIERHLMVEALVEYSRQNLPSLGSYLSNIPHEEVMEAVTAKSCAVGTNYDKLEWLGDAVLKLLHTDALLHSRELRKFVSFLHEGDLTRLRDAMGSNERLKSAAESCGIDKYILVSQLGRGQWIPVSLEMFTVDEENFEGQVAGELFAPGDKTTADIMESLLGLVFLHCGYKASVKVANELGVSLPRDPDISIKKTDTPKNTLLDLAKIVLGKEGFLHPELVEEALTHPSCHHEETPSYQRLEFVGDAVLCLFARDYIYRNYPDLGLAEQNALEMTFVCNETLSYLSVYYGLHRNLNHCDKDLPGRFEDFERCIGPLGRGLWSADPPKVLADIVESMIGAAHVDGGFNDGQSAANHVLQPIIDAVAETFRIECDSANEIKSRAFMHPKQVLHELCGGLFAVKTWKEEEYQTRRLRCPVWRSGRWGTANENGIGFIAVVNALGINVTSVAGVSRQVAKNRLCALTVSAFRKCPELVDKLTVIRDQLRSEGPKDENGEVDQTPRMEAD